MNILYILLSFIAIFAGLASWLDLYFHLLPLTRSRLT
jgi:hypothetical protein